MKRRLIIAILIGAAAIFVVGLIGPELYPLSSIVQRMRKTVQWYLDNLAWCDAVRGDTYAGERLGLDQAAK